MGHNFKTGLLIVAGGVFLSTAPAPVGPRFDRIYPLDPKEGVFAYARISPDGRTLAYASESAEQPGAAPRRVIRVVQLASRKVLFTEPGIDAYWSVDGQRLIFMSHAGDPNITIRHHASGRLVRTVAPTNLGDYYSWGVRDGRNVILTILGNYFYLDGDRGVMPPERVERCPGLDVNERPLISKDGRRITAFVRGSLVIRDLVGCQFFFDTGLRGAKADFSWDGRYVAFHAPKTTLRGYDLKVVDTKMRTVRTITSALGGSSLFPSWTRDGRLCFRYDGEDYRGFMFANDVLHASEHALPTGRPQVGTRPHWSELFPETPQPSERLALVVIWAPWSAHSPHALVELQRAAAYFKRTDTSIAVATALDIGSLGADVDQMTYVNDITLPNVTLAPKRFMATEAVNQIPTSLLFRDGRMIARRLGAQRFDELTAWVHSAWP